MALNNGWQRERTILNPAPFTQEESKIHSVVSMILVCFKPHYLKIDMGEMNLHKAASSYRNIF